MRAAIRALVVLDLAILVATSRLEPEPPGAPIEPVEPSSPPEVLPETAGPFEVELTPEAPVLYLRGGVDAPSVSLELEITGFEPSESLLLVRLYEVPEGATEFLATAVPDGSLVLEVVEVEAGETSLAIDYNAFSPFSLAIELGSDAEIVGELEVTSRGDSEGFWFELDGEEVWP